MVKRLKISLITDPISLFEINFDENFRNRELLNLEQSHQEFKNSQKEITQKNEDTDLHRVV